MPVDRPALLPVHGGDLGMALQAGSDGAGILDVSVNSVQALR